ncbi:hypothetical protein Pelo_19769 [Pelomyxa schiedti]|nr:hypothetical protein Pelo_19769 [Pelomyxa schiedti]
MGLQTKQFMDQEEYFEHTLQHLQKGTWSKTNGSPGNNQCVMEEISITLERHNITFHDSFCTRCPLDKVVKMEVEKRFGVDENQQVVSLVGATPQEEVSLSDTSSTLSSLLPQPTLSSSSGTAVAQVKVRMKPVMTIPESDLILVSTLGRKLL